jgi:alpha-mannosidase
MVWSTDGIPRQGLTGDSKELLHTTTTVAYSCKTQKVINNLTDFRLSSSVPQEGNDRRIEYTLLKNAKGGETIDLFIEMACNGMFGVGQDGLINPPDENRQFLLAQGNLSPSTNHG